jgi:hypothetical protein
MTMEYLGVPFPPIVVGDRSTSCISSYARGLIAEKIAKPPFSFEVSVMKDNCFVVCKRPVAARNLVLISTHPALLLQLPLSIYSQ